jgi:hypothetical protein
MDLFVLQQKMPLLLQPTCTNHCWIQCEDNELQVVVEVHQEKDKSHLQIFAGMPLFAKVHEKV